MTGQRVRVLDRETPEHRRIRLGRENLTETLHTMVTRLDDYRDDPAIMVLMRYGAFTLELFSAHPVDNHGRCTRRDCRRFPGLPKRICPTLCALMFYSHTDIATVWWRALTQLTDKDVPLSTVRDQLERRGLCPTPGEGSHP